jgi:hypothetical protein
MLHTFVTIENINKQKKEFSLLLLNLKNTKWSKHIKNNSKFIISIDFNAFLPSLI